MSGIKQNYVTTDGSSFDDLADAEYYEAHAEEIAAMVKATNLYFDYAGIGKQGRKSKRGYIMGFIKWNAEGQPTAPVATEPTQDAPAANDTAVETATPPASDAPATANAGASVKASDADLASLDGV